MLPAACTACSRYCWCYASYDLESDRAKRAHGGVKNEKFAEIVLIYAGSERSELATSQRQRQANAVHCRCVRRIPALQALVLSQKAKGLPARRWCGGLLCCFW